MSEALFNRWKFEDNTIVGTVIQTGYQLVTASTTGTTTTPLDDTIPTSTEGTQFFNLSITPKKIGNVLKVTCSAFGSVSANTHIVMSLFKNSDAAAIAACAGVSNIAFITLNMTHFVSVSSLDAIEFKVRIGPSSAATYRLNGDAPGAARRFGGVASSVLVVEEIQA